MSYYPSIFCVLKLENDGSVLSKSVVHNIFMNDIVDKIQ